MRGKYTRLDLHPGWGGASRSHCNSPSTITKIPVRHGMLENFGIPAAGDPGIVSGDRDPSQLCQLDFKRESPPVPIKMSYGQQQQSGRVRRYGLSRVTLCDNGPAKKEFSLPFFL